MDDYDQGFFAYYSLKGRDQNPYHAEAQSVSYDRWECGWLDASDIHAECLRQSLDNACSCHQMEE